MSKPSFRMIRSSSWFLKLQIAEPVYTADTPAMLHSTTVFTKLGKESQILPIPEHTLLCHVTAPHVSKR